MSLLNTLLGIIAPHGCVGGCGNEGTLLCSECVGLLPRPSPRCYRCGAFSADWSTCRPCRKRSRLAAVRVATIYEGLAKDLVWKLKFEGAQTAAAEMATLMGSLLSGSVEGAIIAHVPTATSRVRQRGYDQARLIARELARRAGCQYAPRLRRLGQHHQVGAAASQRRQQMVNAFRPYGRHMRRAHIILVDDVLTTGATLEAAAAALRKAGAKRVEAIVFAQAQ